MGIFLDAAKTERLPVSLITGFLGSGKTTLLNRLIQQDEMANAAVLINEFGDVPLDQHFIEKKQDDVIVMPNGCLCCSVQDDFEGVMGSLFGRRRGGEIKPFDRLVIETTGLADPTSIIQLLLNSPLIVQNFALDSVIATVDAVHAREQLRSHPEAATQIAVADRLVITKTDLVEPAAVEELKTELASLNATATVLSAQYGDVPAAQLFSAGILDADGAKPDRWLGHPGNAEAEANHKTGDVSTFSLVTERPLPWGLFNRWLTQVKVRHGEQLLRVKGLLNVQGESEPVAIHGVHHVFHPPVRLENGFGNDRRTRLVFIVRGNIRQDIGRAWLEMLIEANQQPAANLEQRT